MIYDIITWIVYIHLVILKTNPNVIFPNDNHETDKRMTSQDQVAGGNLGRLKSLSYLKGTDIVHFSRVVPLK